MMSRAPFVLASPKDLPMNCCSTGGDPAAPSVSAPTRRFSRIATLIQWALPITTLALVPKCPGCVAAYVLLFSGVGLSIPGATATRWALIGVSVAALVFLVFRVARRALTPGAR
jgi:hypothetical protein